MDKVCIFCGQKPESKNKEHIIPKWLLEMTGNPGRKVYLGRDWTHPKLIERKFGWSSFTFPTCRSCNYEYSKLESKTQLIMTQMLQDAPLSAEDFDNFLDWLDKVRTGLWLAMTYLNKNYRGLAPQFHIKQRIAAKDRCVCIYRSTDTSPGIGISAVDTPIFHKMPSAFILIVNQLHFVSISYDFLVSRRIGWPYPAKRALEGNKDGFWASIVSGTERIQLPVLNYELKLGGTRIMQPIIHRDLALRGYDNLPVEYRSKYVEAMLNTPFSGKGLIYIEAENSFAKYPSQPEIRWIPPETFTRNELMAELGLQIGQIQDDLFIDVPSMKWLSKERQKELQAEIAGVRQLHSKIMQHFFAQAEPFLSGKKGT